jgi:hypothetical protein
LYLPIVSSFREQISLPWRLCHSTPARPQILANPAKTPRKFACTMPDDFARSSTCPSSFPLARQTARAWPDGVEDDQQSSSQETKSDKEIESIVSGSNQPQNPEAMFSTQISSIHQDQSQISSCDSESSSDSGSLPEPSTTELHDGNSPKRQKVIIFDWHSIR